MNWYVILAVIAMFYAGLMVWLHGVYVGMRDNDLAVYNAARKLAESRRQVQALRGQVAILEAGMLCAPADLWADFDRSGS